MGANFWLPPPESEALYADYDGNFINHEAQLEPSKASFLQLRHSSSVIFTVMWRHISSASLHKIFFTAKYFLSGHKIVSSVLILPITMDDEFGCFYQHLEGVKLKLFFSPRLGSSTNMRPRAKIYIIIGTKATTL